MLIYQLWPNMTMSSNDFKVNSNKADIAVNVPNQANHDINEFKLNSNIADIAVNLPNVVKHDYVNIRIQGQLKQNGHCCKCSKCGQT